MFALQGADLQAALAYLQHAAALKALSPHGYLALGDVHQQAGDLEAALAVLGYGSAVRHPGG